MPRDLSFYQYVLNDLLADIPSITSKKMFGGWGLYYHKRIFAIIAESQLYFKVNASLISDFQKLGSRPFVYYRGDRPVELSYWLLPDALKENKNLLEEWIARSAAIHLKNRPN